MRLMRSGITLSQVSRQAIFYAVPCALATLPMAPGLAQVQPEAPQAFSPGLLQTIALPDGQQLSYVEYQQQIQSLQQSVSLPETGDRFERATALQSLSDLYRVGRRFEEALEVGQQAISLAHSIGDRYREAVALRTVGAVYAAEGQYRKALEQYDKSLSAAQETHDRDLQLAIQGDRIGVYTSLGQMDEADRLRQWVSRQSQAEGYVLQAFQLGTLGIEEQSQQSRALIQQALSIYRMPANEREERRFQQDGEANALNVLSEVYRASGQYQAMLEAAQRTQSVAHDVGDRQTEANALGRQGDAYLGLRQYQKAVELYRQSFAIADQIHDPGIRYSFLPGILDAYSGLGQTQQAESLRRQYLSNVPSPNPSELSTMATQPAGLR